MKQIVVPVVVSTPPSVRISTLPAPRPQGTANPTQGSGGGGGKQTPGKK